MGGPWAAARAGILGTGTSAATSAMAAPSVAVAMDHRAGAASRVRAGDAPPITAAMAVTATVHAREPPVIPVRVVTVAVPAAAGAMERQFQSLFCRLKLRLLCARQLVQALNRRLSARFRL